GDAAAQQPAFLLDVLHAGKLPPVGRDAFHAHFARSRRFFMATPATCLAKLGVLQRRRLARNPWDQAENIYRAAGAAKTLIWRGISPTCCPVLRPLASPA